MTAEHRQALYGGKMFTFGHRQKFGNDPEKRCGQELRQRAQLGRSADRERSFERR